MVTHKDLSIQLISSNLFAIFRDKIENLVKANEIHLKNSVFTKDNLFEKAFKFFENKIMKIKNEPAREEDNLETNESSKKIQNMFNDQNSDSDLEKPSFAGDTVLVTVQELQEIESILQSENYHFGVRKILKVNPLDILWHENLSAITNSLINIMLIQDESMAKSLFSYLYKLYYAADSNNPFLSFEIYLTFMNCLSKIVSESEEIKQSIKDLLLPEFIGFVCQTSESILENESRLNDEFISNYCSYTAGFYKFICKLDLFYIEDYSQGFVSVLQNPFTIGCLINKDKKWLNVWLRKGAFRKRLCPLLGSFKFLDELCRICDMNNIRRMLLDQNVSKYSLTRFRNTFFYSEVLLQITSSCLSILRTFISSQGSVIIYDSSFKTLTETAISLSEIFRISVTSYLNFNSYEKILYEYYDFVMSFYLYLNPSDFHINLLQKLISLKSELSQQELNNSSPKLIESMRCLTNLISQCSDQLYEKNYSKFLKNVCIDLKIKETCDEYFNTKYRKVLEPYTFAYICSSYSLGRDEDRMAVHNFLLDLFNSKKFLKSKSTLLLLIQTLMKFDSFLKWLSNQIDIAEQSINFIVDTSLKPQDEIIKLRKFYIISNCLSYESLQIIINKRLPKALTEYFEENSKDAKDFIFMIFFTLPKHLIISDYTIEKEFDKYIINYESSLFIEKSKYFILCLKLLRRFCMIPEFMCILNKSGKLFRTLLKIIETRDNLNEPDNEENYEIKKLFLVLQKYYGLILYKKFADAKTNEEIENSKKELITNLRKAIIDSSVTIPDNFIDRIKGCKLFLSSNEKDSPWEFGLIKALTIYNPGEILISFCVENDEDYRKVYCLMNKNHLFDFIINQDSTSLNKFKEKVISNIEIDQKIKIKCIFELNGMNFDLVLTEFITSMFLGKLCLPKVIKYLEILLLNETPIHFFEEIISKYFNTNWWDVNTSLIKYIQFCNHY